MLALMTVGHIAWAFVDMDSVWSDIMHFLARPTLPLACFLVVVGFCKTHDLAGYICRMFGFALLAQLPFVAMQLTINQIIQMPSVLFWYGNVLFNLGIGICTLVLVGGAYRVSDKVFLTKVNACFDTLPSYIANLCKAVLLSAMAWLSTYLDWGIMVMSLVVALHYFGIAGFVLINALFLALSVFFDSTLLPLNAWQIMDYGVFLAPLIIYWYQKRLSKDLSSDNLQKPTYRLPRTLFYWYYIVHMSVIGVLVNIINS